MSENSEQGQQEVGISPSTAEIDTTAAMGMDMTEIPVPTSAKVAGLDASAAYEVVRARDRRFDGRIFIGVRSTRIYCRPVCTVRPPKFENCTFHPSAAACEKAGFRPCLRCRPELAPGTTAPVDAVSRLATLAVRRIEDGALGKGCLEALAAEFGVSARHLRRAVVSETGLSPVEIAQTQRLLLAKQLLTDTRMSVTEAAFAAGFESLRRFNHAFKTRYRLTPTALRNTVGRSETEDAYQFKLSVRLPFDLQDLLAFLSMRATPGVESVSGGWYRRTVKFSKHSGWIAIGQGDHPHTVKLLVSHSLGPVVPTVLSRAKALCDSRAEPSEVCRHLAADPLLAPLVARWPGVRVPGVFDGFECGVRTILGQQVSVKAATTLAGRLAARFGTTTTTPHAELTTVFPTATALAEADSRHLMATGLTIARADTVRAFARAMADGQFLLEPGADPDRVRESLLCLPGIGPWTADYLLLRAVGWPDAFPDGDLALRKAVGLSGSELRSRTENWRPWRGYAAILLWRSLSDSILPRGTK